MTTAIIARLAALPCRRIGARADVAIDVGHDGNVHETGPG
jgi:hypothetical protein